MWSDIHLDEDVPFILWRPEQHKNRKRMEVAISGEVSAALRRSYDGICGGVVSESRVFPACPPPAAFHKDRDVCGIPASDRRDRGFSPHSARKFFASTLTSLNVNPRVIDVLMRHTSGVQGRYVDLPLREQVNALQGFPKLLPDFFWKKC